MTPGEAYEKARREGPSDETRNSVLSSSWYAYMYANYVDKCPRDDTRNAVLSDSYSAYMYAEDIDKCWRVDTWTVVGDSVTKDPMPFEYSLKWLVLGDIPVTMVLT